MLDLFTSLTHLVSVFFCVIPKKGLYFQFCILLLLHIEICSQTVAVPAQRCTTKAKLVFFLLFFFYLSLFQFQNLLCVCQSTQMSREVMAGPPRSSQKEQANKKEQILLTKKIHWDSFLGFCSGTVLKKTGQIITINLKSHVNTKGSIAVYAVLLYNIILRFLGEILLFFFFLDPYCEALFLK